MSQATERTTTGLEYLRRIVSCELPQIPIGVTLGFRVVEAENGRVVLLGNPDTRAYNLIGTVHGGWAASIPYGTGVYTGGALNQYSSNISSVQLNGVGRVSARGGYGIAECA